MGLRTVVLKLHKPTKAKQKIIDKALADYNNAFCYLMDKAFSNIPDLERFRGKDGRFNSLALSKWVDKDIGRELNGFGVQPFKDSLRLEFGTAAEGCLRLGNGMKRKDIGKPRPIYFCRYDTKRNYCLLYNAEKDRYYAKLYLLNGSNARGLPEHSGYHERLVHIHKDCSVLERTGRREAFIVVPLDFGLWQEKILKEAAKAPESFRTARLFEKDGEYYLAVSIETGDKENIKPETFMSVSRGIKNRLCFTVLNEDGEILSQGLADNAISSGSIKGISINELHAAANFIVDIAADYKAQVIVQNLPERGDKLSWTENGQDWLQPEYKRGDYNRLIRLLDYKLSWKCLPKPVRVSPVGMFYTCADCGMNSKGNRLNKDFFICTRCGSAMEIDKLGSLNLARKLIAYRASKIRVKVSKTEDGVVFTNRILGLELFSGYRENQLNRLKNEIERIIQSAEGESKASSERAQVRKMSVLRKMKSAVDFMELIEYI